ncbi:hypothetical protein [Portibacter lacus]|nr:hypothetical protein [Portibacter lacus]
MKVRNDLSLFSIAAGISLGLTTIIGLPAGRYTLELDISLEILDVNQNIVEIYNGKGKQRAIIGAYYGYGENSAKEKCLYESMEMCLTQINEKVMRDFDRIEAKLIKIKKQFDLETSAPEE